MAELPFLPDLPLTLSYPLLFGVLLVAGMLGGEAARHLRLPRIIGYVLVGFAIAPAAAAMNIGPLLEEARMCFSCSRARSSSAMPICRRSRCGAWRIRCWRRSRATSARPAPCRSSTTRKSSM